MGEEKKNKRNKDFEVLTFALTLLAGISAVLLKLVDYFNNNIIDLSERAWLLVYFLVFFLLIEILIILLFLLLKGLLSAQEKRINVLEIISELSQIFMFCLPLIVLVFSFLIIIDIWNKWNISIPILLLSISLIILLIYYYLHNLTFDFKSFSRNNIKESFKKKFKKIIDIFQKEIISWDICLIVATIFVIIFVTIFILSLQTTTFLLCGSYLVEIIHPPDPNTDIMSVAIRDTGIPSGRCFIDLSKVNESNESHLFESIDNITLNESGKSLSKHKYIVGEKRNGIYYFFINTSNLSSDDYLLHAEVTFPQIKGFDLFLPKKLDDKLFRLSPKNMTTIFVVHREI